MSVLIRDMEMPKTGEYRCVIRKWQQGGTITIDLYGEEELSGTIVPVPPHGRLIDADALRAEVKKHATPSDANVLGTHSNSAAEWLDWLKEATDG